MKKNKIILYSVLPAVAFLGTALTTYFAFEMTVTWAILFGLAGMTVVFAVTRFGYSMSTNECNARVLNSIFWNMMAFIGIGGFCLSSTAAFQKAFIALLVYSTISTFGTAFIMKDSDVVTVDGAMEEIVGTAEAVTGTDAETLRNTLRYKKVGDKLDGELDINRPLCQVVGKNLTVEEALAQGYGNVAADGINYINSLLN